MRDLRAGDSVKLSRYRLVPGFLPEQLSILEDLPCVAVIEVLEITVEVEDGLEIVKEFSIYRVGRDGRNVVISADTGGCYRVRVPGWDDPSASVRRAEMHVDIRP